MTQEALKLALELKNSASAYWTENEISIIEKLIELLADPMREVQRFGQEIEQEPVVTKDSGGQMTLHLGWDDLPDGTKLYATSPQRKPLTDEEMSDIWYKQSTDWMEFARAIEATHGIKENT